MVSGFEDALGDASLVDGGADLVYYGGLPGNQPLADAEAAKRLMVTDAELAPDVFEPPGTLATSAALDPSQLPPAGQEFVAAFEHEYDRAPGRYAAYGYEAMAVILDSIDRASDPTDRPSVIDAFFETSDRDSILGTYSIDELGGTTLERMTGYELGGGRPKPVARARRQRLDQVAQRRLDLGEAERVAEVERAAGDRADAGEDLPGELLAAHRGEREPRHRHHRGPVQRGAERLRELAVGGRVRRRRVQRSGRLRRSRGPRGSTRPRRRGGSRACTGVRRPAGRRGRA